MLNGNKLHASAFSDMKHEPLKFWLAETIVFNLYKVIPVHDVKHRHPFSYFFSGKGVAVHMLVEGNSILEPGFNYSLNERKDGLESCYLGGV